MLRPSMGEQIPSDPKEIAKSFGMGWWKPDPQAAPELLEKAGFKKRGNAWLTPDGKPFTMRVMVEGESRPVMTRAGSMIVQQWRQFGIDAKVDVAQGTLLTRRAAGDFDTMISWSVETWGGHQDLVLLPRQLALAVRRAARHAAAAAQLAALVEPGARQDHRADPQRSASTIPKAIELGREYVKLAAREMPTIPLMAYNVFTVMDETYWTGYPTAENDPYTDPVPNWGNSRACS